MISADIWGMRKLASDESFNINLLMKEAFWWKVDFLNFRRASLIFEKFEVIKRVLIKKKTFITSSRKGYHRQYTVIIFILSLAVQFKYHLTNNFELKLHSRVARICIITGLKIRQTRMMPALKLTNNWIIKSSDAMHAAYTSLTLSLPAVQTVRHCKL